MQDPFETMPGPDASSPRTANPDEPRSNALALLERIEELESQLQDRDNILQGIRGGDVDAVLVDTEAGDFHLYTLQSVDKPYEIFVQQIREGAVTLSTDGIILYGNMRLAAMLGLSEEQMIGQGLQRFLVAEDVPVLNEMLVRAETLGARNELTLCSPNGNQLPVYVSLNFLRHSENATLLCGVVTDLSEQKNHLRKMTEANVELVSLTADLQQARDVAEEANRAKTRFLTGISHELRTPLNCILGYAQLLGLDQKLSASHLAKVDAMREAGAHLLTMINGVLSLSEFEAEHTVTRTSRTDVQGIARACLDLFRPTAAAKHLLVNLAVAPNAPACITTDPIRLRQVLVNLVGNAVKFTEGGSIELRLQSAAGGLGLRIEVADTGGGIPANLQHRLFQEFERLSTGVSGRAEGAGLGLALSARLVAGMGGRMGYEDNPTGGSVFWLELPVQDDAVASPVSQRKNVDPVITTANPLRILVVDDIAMNRDIAGSFLRVAGHDILFAADGREALAAVAAEDFDIVLMDVRMPEMDGREATRRIRTLEGPRGRVPIVALTAHAFSAQIKECLEAGMNDHLCKPLELGLLLETVERVAAASRTVATHASPVVPSVSAPAHSVSASEAPVLNLDMFEATATVLTPDAVASYLSELLLQCETLLDGLHALDAAKGKGLGEAAHVLAGSAGMFGFERLAAAGRYFDRAIQNGAVELPALTEGLCAALETALEAMRDKMVLTA